MYDYYGLLPIKPCFLSLFGNIKWKGFYPSLRQPISFRNPVDSPTEAVKVVDPKEFIQVSLVSALMASGFRKISGDVSADYFLPCPLGTFSNLSSQGAEGCTPCPPGM